VKPLKLMIKNETYIRTFAAIGEEAQISTTIFDAIKEFVCELYDHKDFSTDNVRRSLTNQCMDYLEAEAIPPCTDSLHLHFSRANYQTHYMAKLYGTNS